MTDKTCPVVLKDYGPRYGEVCGRPVGPKSETGLCRHHAMELANAKHPRRPNSPWRAWRGGPHPKEEAS